jgi:hypothetical protein
MVPDVKLTGRAARWVQLLQDFGHLDPEGANRLMVGIAELQAADGGRCADLSLVRRAAAIVLFGDGEAEGPSVLDDDWPLLFS